MANPLKIIHLEDNPNDALLVRETLEQEGIEATLRCVSDRAGFVFAIRQQDADLVLSDYSLPQFDGLSALSITRELAPDLPFILVSGTLGEDAAVESQIGRAHV